MTRRPNLLAVGAAFFAVYVIWGSTYLAIAVAVQSIPPLLMMGARSFLAGAVLYGVARAAGAPAPDRAAWGNALLVGSLFFVIGHGLLSLGAARVPSGAAAVIVATEPLFIVLLGWRGGVATGGARTGMPSPGVLLAIVLGLVGVGVLTLPSGSGALDPLGAAAMVLAALSWAVGTFHVAAGGPPLRAAGMQLLAGGSVLLVLSVLLGEVSGWRATSVTTASLLGFLHLVVFGSVVTYAAYVWLLGRIGPARVASHTFVNPVIALALGAWLGGEVFSGRMLFASLLVLVGVVLLLRARSSGEGQPDTALESARATLQITPTRSYAPTPARARSS